MTPADGTASPANRPGGTAGRPGSTATPAAGPNLARSPGGAALVTGAARGIGRAVAVGLAAHGFAVTCAARTLHEGESTLPGSLDGTVARITAAGGRGWAVRCDMTRRQDLDHAFLAAQRHAGGSVEVVVHAAMQRLNRPFAELDLEGWHRTVTENLAGLYLLCERAVEAMAGHGGGSIIVLSSAMADKDRSLPPGYTPYAVVKAATERMVTALAGQLSPHNVAINAVRPGAVRTEYAQAELGPGHDFSRWRDPDSVVPAVLWLARQRGTGATGTVIEASAHHRDAARP
jgi:NAD(P)-dependent dehydrogenase (short-subunit alcohol dehydrogenase family)